MTLQFVVPEMLYTKACVIHVMNFTLVVLRAHSITVYRNIYNLAEEQAYTNTHHCVTRHYRKTFLHFPSLASMIALFAAG